MASASAMLAARPLTLSANAAVAVTAAAGTSASSRATASSSERQGVTPRAASADRVGA